MAHLGEAKPSKHKRLNHAQDAKVLKKVGKVLGHKPNLVICKKMLHN